MRKNGWGLGWVHLCWSPLLKGAQLKCSHFPSECPWTLKPWQLLWGGKRWKYLFTTLNHLLTSSPLRQSSVLTIPVSFTFGSNFNLGHGWLWPTHPATYERPFAPIILVTGGRWEGRVGRSKAPTLRRREGHNTLPKRKIQKKYKNIARGTTDPGYWFYN